MAETWRAYPAVVAAFAEKSGAEGLLLFAQSLVDAGANTTATEGEWLGSRRG